MTNQPPERGLSIGNSAEPTTMGRQPPRSAARLLGGAAARLRRRYSRARKKSDEALFVTAADKIHNASCVAADLRSYGPAFWSTFNASERKLLWSYAAVAAAVRDRLGLSSVTEHLRRVVDDLFAAAAEADRLGFPTSPSACGRTEQ
ncbi:hypothetical protein [Modestobacter caceresii]|uniref:hypothetical protein n=1 Tax=Modestobacter caceresii TaxID=1522368 RepID=UPI0012E08AF8|nr:hypothetical protein [Modestobacter caceresii]